MIVLFLTGVVAMIMLRTLKNDISTYNEMQTLEEAQEESGWKLVHGDVFRPPSFSPMLLSVLAGSGIQLLAMTFCTMLCALLGLLSPDNRGGLLTALLLIFVFMGAFAGYWSARVYKLFHGKEWKRSTMLTALLYPGVMGVIFLGVNTIIFLQGSSTTAPLTSLLSVLVLWFGVSTPLVFVGSYFGFKKETIDVPVRTNQIARHIPEQAWYTNPLFNIALCGILPFGAVCIELFFIMSAIWLHQIYYVFGFLFIVLVILVLTCAEITIVMCYFQLCNEDYRWCWKSYISSGSSGLYLFLYSVWYYSTKLDINQFIPTLLYFAYMSMISITFFMVTGSVGFFACLWFVRKIYGAIKVD
jgi:transmembrane 9 superfamily protein 2/4